MQSCEIKVGICIAYDWEMLKTSLPIIYPFADKICLAIDKNRKTWAGNVFEFNENLFFSYINEVDKDNKIHIYEEDFSIDSSNPMKGEVYQRNKMAEALGSGGWHIQIDVDEYIIEMEIFANFLRGNYDRFLGNGVNICLPFTIMFKKIKKEMFFIKGTTEWVPVATNKPNYQFGRRNGYFNYKYHSPVIHQSWAREVDEIHQKINNWGHRDDFDVNTFFERWKTLNSENYKEWLNFHPIDGNVWNELVLVKAKNLDELIKAPEKLNKLHNYTKLGIMLRNNRFVAKLLQIFQIK